MNDDFASRRLFVGSVIGLAVGGVPALAFAEKQTGLYAASPPPNSCFVRVAAMGGAAQAAIGTVKLSAPAGGVSAYKVVPQGAASVKAGKASLDANFLAGKFYTVAVGAAKIASIEDMALTNKAKALIVFYNFTKQPLDLTTADGTTKVIAAVAPGKSGARLVNAATAPFGVFAKDVVAKTGSQVLTRGASYAAVATESGGKVSLMWQRSDIA